jgi:hypothetical protein
LKGTLRGDKTIDYKLNAKTGQTMSVTLKTGNGANYFNVLPPGSNDVAVFVGSSGGAEWTGQLAADGEYTIRVYLMRNAARRNESANYTLDVGVSGAVKKSEAAAPPGPPAGPLPATGNAGPSPAAPSDVGTIEDIVRVSYEVISGPAGAPRQWERDRTLYMPGATFVVTSKRDGKVETTILTTEEYRRKSDARFVAQGLFETEIGSRVERFGNVAQVRSVSESRRAPGGAVDARYVNYLQLFWDGTRWWIAGAVWDQERPDSPIPEEWLNAPKNGSE